MAWASGSLGSNLLSKEIYSLACVLKVVFVCLCSKVLSSEGDEMSKMLKIEHMEISAKKKIDVDAAFFQLVRLVRYMACRMG